MPTPPDLKPRPLIPLDAGWLLLLPGLALLGAVMLAPAWGELAETRRARDAELARESHARERLARYEAFVEAYDSGDEDLLERLRIAQLNALPDNRSPLPGMERTLEAGLGPDGLPAADVFAWLEPPPPAPDPRGPPATPAQQWAERVAGLGPRLWLIGLGGGLTFAGLVVGIRSTPGGPPGGTDGGTSCVGPGAPAG